MLNPVKQPDKDFAKSGNTSLFESIANDIFSQGYSIQPHAFPVELLDKLYAYLEVMPSSAFSKAGLGRASGHQLNETVRSDDICWMNRNNGVGAAWFEWVESLQVFLNRHLLLGLFSVESHFAHYAPGDFYKKHTDAFKGEANRVLSMVVYLNRDWQAEDAGELLIYTGEVVQSEIKVSPDYGTIVVFLSENFPHEVLPARRDRLSIATWFRVINSITERIDPS